MIICPACRHAEIAGALFCSECGANLISASPPEGSVPASKDNPIAVILLIDSGETLPIFEKHAVVLGRASSAGAAQPDIDLGPYGGYDAGVSRQHALIQLVPQVLVTDLGSANGTLLNGQLLPARIPFPLYPADLLTLGKLRIQVVIQK